MTQGEIIEMARQADIKYRTDVFYSQFCDGVYEDDLKAFAKLVAKHTLLNTDPNSFMSYQEGVEAGRLAEREACANVCDALAVHPEYASEVTKLAALAIRARGNT